MDDVNVNLVSSLDIVIVNVNVESGWAIIVNALTKFF